MHLDEAAHRRLLSRTLLNKCGVPTRNPLRAFGIDGGYVKASDVRFRQEEWFEMMVGDSLPRTGSSQVFAFAHRLEPKLTDRMERFLAEQGAYPAQPTTFLSDGGDTVRVVHGEFWKFSEPILDWFHATMRITVSQAIKSLPREQPEEKNSATSVKDCLRGLRRAKAYFWHGSAHRAVTVLEELIWDIGTE